MSQQQILKQMTHDIHCMCKKLQQYMEDNQIECKKDYKKEWLKYEEHLKKDRIEREKEQIKHKKEQIERKKEQLKDAKEHKKERLECQNDFNVWRENHANHNHWTTDTLLFDLWNKKQIHNHKRNSYQLRFERNEQNEQNE